LRATKQYEVNSTFQRFYTSNITPEGMIIVTVIHMMEVGYGSMTQRVIANVDEPSDILAQKCF